MENTYKCLNCFSCPCREKKTKEINAYKESSAPNLKVKTTSGKKINENLGN
jgi:hypothetical protein